MAWWKGSELIRHWCLCSETSVSGPTVKCPFSLSLAPFYNYDTLQMSLLHPVSPPALLPNHGLFFLPASCHSSWLIIGTPALVEIWFAFFINIYQLYNIYVYCPRGEKPFKIRSWLYIAFVSAVRLKFASYRFLLVMRSQQCHIFPISRRFIIKFVQKRNIWDNSGKWIMTPIIIISNNSPGSKKPQSFIAFWTQW